MNDTNAYPCFFESEKTNLKEIRRIEELYFIFHENGSALTNRVTEDRPFLGKKKEHTVDTVVEKKNSCNQG